MSFAQNLKYIKEKENLTNYRLAKLFGCSQSSLINWLDNGVVPHPKTRQKIADHFGITLAELDGDELPVLPEKGTEKAPAPKEDERLAFDEANMRVRSAHPVSVLAAKYNVPSAVMQQIIGCDLDTANGIILGLADPTDEQLRRVAATFCVPYADLIEGWVAMAANPNVLSDISRRVSDRFPLQGGHRASEDEP